jgi:Tfp pilus assembly protein PilF/uncharacterized membrane protein (UPF0127 family)
MINIRSVLWISLWFILLIPCKGICFDTGEVVLITPEKVKNLAVLIAKTPEEWQQGLQGMDGLKEDEGLFFLFPREGIITFTTKGVTFPIDIILINKTGRVIKILENSPGDLNHASPLPIIAALEVKGGFCRENGVRAGSFIHTAGFRLIPKDKARPRQEDMKKVEAKLEENLEKYPDDPTVYEELAVFYTVSGQNKKAVEIYRKLLEMDSTASRLNGMGVALASMGHREEAEQYFIQALEKDPLFFRSYNNLIRISRARNDLDHAVSLLQEAIRTQPEFIEARLKLARLYLARGDFDAAEILIEETGNESKIRPEVIRLAGDIHLRKGEYQKAADNYLNYLEARPYDLHAPDLRVFIMVHKVKKAQMNQ